MSGDAEHTAENDAAPIPFTSDQIDRLGHWLSECLDDAAAWWETDEPCVFCGGDGEPARAALAPARSWRNPATWVSRAGWTEEP